MEQAVASWLSDFGAPALFVLLAIGVVGLPLPDETLLALAGVLIGRGRLNPVTAAAAAIGGAMTGITLSYGVGRFAGLPLLLRYGSRVHVDTAVITRVGPGSIDLESGYWLADISFLAFVTSPRSSRGRRSSLSARSWRLRTRARCCGRPVS